MEKKKKLSLFQKAAVTMSLLSWYTTYSGFKTSVFSNGQGLTAGLASMAIQVILLGGVLYLFPILELMYKKAKKKIQGIKEANGTKKARIKIIGETVKHLFMIIAVIGIFVLAMLTSIMFSYISISNNVYKTDFAVNANIKLDGFMRKTIQEMETDNQEYLDAMRTEIIVQFRQNGKEVIKQSARKRAIDYANTTETLLRLVETKELVSLDNTIKKFTKRNLLKNDEGEVKYEYRSINQDYTDELYRDFIIDENLENTRFAAGVKNKINNMNRDKYAIYSEYHYQYLAAVECYNEWINNLKNEENEDVPTLEQMRSLRDFCKTIQTGLKNLKKALDEMKDSHAKGNTTRLIEEAKMNMDSLILEVDNIQNKTEILINNSYGENSLSFEQLISAFGSSETSWKVLDQARKQLLEIQGTLLSDENFSTAKIDNITTLMHNLEEYIDAVDYNNKLHLLKQKVNSNYNIVDSKEDSESSVETQRKNTIPHAAIGSDIESVTIESVSVDEDKISTPVSGGAVSSGAISVIDITSEKWTEVKKSQMTELDSLIYNNPVNLYYSEVKKGELKDSVKKNVKDSDNEDKNTEINKNQKFESIYRKYKNDAVTYRKSYLDTSEMEKAYNLIAGDNELFPYKGKAKLALVFAIFLDFGAFLIGAVMFFFNKT